MNVFYTKLLLRDETFLSLEGNMQLCMYLLYGHNTEKTLCATKKFELNSRASLMRVVNII